MRGHNGPYYTRSKRVNGRVVREYVGGGELGRLAAEMDEFETAERAAEAEKVRAEKARLKGTSCAVSVLFGMAEDLTRAALQAQGFHLHKGEWRRRRKAVRR